MGVGHPFEVVARPFEGVVAEDFGDLAEAEVDFLAGVEEVQCHIEAIEVAGVMDLAEVMTAMVLRDIGILLTATLLKTMAALDLEEITGKGV